MSKINCFAFREANAGIQLSLSSDYNVKDTTVGELVDDMKAGMTAEDVDVHNEDDIISDHGNVALLVIKLFIE